MTSVLPDAIGHPDWIALDPKVGAPIINETVNLTFSKSWDGIYVGQWEALEVVLQPGTAGRRWRLWFIYTAVSPTLNDIGSQHFDCESATYVYDVVPVLGSYVSVLLECSSYVGNPSAYISVTPRQGISRDHRWSEDLVLGSELDVNVAAATTYAVIVPFMAAGPATFTVVAGSNSTWFAHILSEDFNNLNRYLAPLNYSSPGIGNSVPFLAPRRTLVARIRNNAAAAQLFSWTIVAGI